MEREQESGVEAKIESAWSSLAYSYSCVLCSKASGCNGIIFTCLVVSSSLATENQSIGGGNPSNLYRSYLLMNLRFFLLHHLSINTFAPAILQNSLDCDPGATRLRIVMTVRNLLPQKDWGSLVTELLTTKVDRFPNIKTLK